MYITENKRKSTLFSHIKAYLPEKPSQFLVQLSFSAFIWSNWCFPICYKNRFLLTRAVFLPSPSLLLSLPMQIFIEVLLRSQKTKVSFPFPLAKRKSTRSPPFPVQRVAAYLRIYRLFIPVFEGKPRKCSGLFFTPQKSRQKYEN